MILVCEPECKGFAHEKINAAYLLSLSIAFPQEEILFVGEMQHIICLKENLKNYKIDIEYLDVGIPDPSQSNYIKLFLFYRLNKMLFGLVDKFRINRLMYLSISSSNLYVLKFFLKNNKSCLSCVVVIHGILENIKKSWIKMFMKIFGFPFWFRIPLTLFQIDNLKYIVLSEGVKSQLLATCKELKGKVYATFFPYIYDEYDKKRSGHGHNLIFGSFGGIKSPSEFLALANNLYQLQKKFNSNFLVIGPGANINFPDNVRIPSQGKRLNRSQMREYAQQIDYSVFVYPRGAYTLMASGAFFDAISYVKPIIAIRTPFFEECFRLMGDVGYLCEDIVEMENLLTSLIINQSSERYNNQCQNILKARDCFSPCKLSKTLQNIFMESSI